MKVLITGSSGSIGSAIASHLMEKNIPVVALDLKNLPCASGNGYYKFHNCSITEKDKLEKIFEEERPTHVIHLASTFHKIRDRQLEYQIDVGGSAYILDICNRTSSVKQLVFSSSATIYGAHRDNPEWISETDPVRPGNYVYGLNKKHVEELLLNSPVRDDLHRVLCRICTVIGPTYNKPATIVSMLLKVGWLPSFAKNTRVQFIHTDDLAELIHLILKDDEITGIYNLAPDSYSQIKSLMPGKKFIWIPLGFVRLVISVLWPLRLLNLEPAGVNASIYPIVLDSEKLISRFNYRFRYSSDQAFGDVKIRNMIPADARF
ncbi:MAG: NAD-dependent epimerase/dehydratase family protein [Bacteroidales bacterium]|jgi:UDP-glucose 4-epimerase|nr:NAD-dependent epimerase/dehydratase family protein [Bacteroidales bacterium]